MTTPTPTSITPNMEAAMPPNSTLEVARDYLALHPNRYVFAIKAGSKYPPILKKNLDENCSNDPEQIAKWHAKWPGCAWGVAHKKSGISVIDVDMNPAKGKVGLESFKALEEKYGPLPETERTETPSGGFHLIYEGEHITAYGESGYGRHIDSPNYTLIPGNVMKDGGVYVSNGKPAVAAPPWMKEKLSERRKTLALEGAAEPVIELDLPSNIASAIVYLKHDAEPAIDGNNGDLQTFKVAVELRDLGISQDLAVDLLNEHYNDRCSPPWEIEGLIAKAHNAYNYANLRAPGSRSAVYDFGDDIEEIAASIKPKGYERAKIKYRSQNMPKAVEDAMRAIGLDKHHDHIFQRAAQIVRLNQNPRTEQLADAKPGQMARKRGALMIREVVPDYMALRLAEAARIFTAAKPMGRPKKLDADTEPTSKPEWREGGVPQALVKAIMAAETRWTFDPLEGIIEAPTMLLDGSILDKPGYDRATGLYYDPRNVPEMAPIKAAPTADDALAGLAEIDDVLNEFAFADDEDAVPGQSQSAAIAAIMAAGVRRVLPMCPAFLIDAPGQSNGKTLLADLIATIWTGRGAGATTWAADSAEQRKVITSILMAGDLVVNFDNVAAPVGGPAICAVMTAQENFKDRLLGSSKMLDLPTSVLWMFTGNNMTVRDDMSTRVLRIRLDAQCERPDLRSFKRSDLLGHVKAQRGTLIHAVLTILRAYILAGKPLTDIHGRPFTVSGRFNAFSSLVAAALVWLGRPDPLGSQQAMVSDDPVREARQSLLGEWRTTYGFDVWVTAKQIKGCDFGHDADKVREALDDIEGGGSGSSPNAIASKLKTLEKLILGGMKLERRPAKTNQPSAWRLIEVNPAGPDPYADLM
jgi:putative DNA primase/helicase